MKENIYQHWLEQQPKLRSCLRKLSHVPQLIAEYDGKHLRLTAFGERYLRELFILVHKGLIELTPPTERGQHCRIRGTCYEGPKLGNQHLP